MKVIVFSRTYVPGHGMGPFITPIEIDDARTIANLRRRGRIRVIKEKPVVKKPVPPVVEEEKVIEIPVIVDDIEEPIMEELEKELKKEIVEEPVEEVKEEPVVEEEPIEEVKEELTEEMLMEETVSQIKARLIKANIDFLYKDTKKELIAKLLRNQ